MNQRELEELLTSQESRIRELQAVLRPRLDDPLINYPQGVVCLFCKKLTVYFNGAPQSFRHGVNCPVTRREELLS